MPRIFKGSESTLRLLISKTGDYQALTGIKIKLYTTDIENAIEIIDGIQVCKNIAIITLAPRAFMGMEDGLINYIIDGATEDDVFHTERQSNYMLKSLSYINEDGVATQTMTIESNGEYRVTPNDGLYVDINVNVPDLNGSYDDGFNVGYNQGKTDGANEQKDKLVSINITENGTYSKEDGYGQVVVEVPDLNGDYNEGYEQGKAEQKGKLVSINITENGTYSKEDGYNHIEVNVPDLNGSYDEGYRDGEQAGYNSGYDQGQADVAANARVLNVTENGIYTSKYTEEGEIVMPELWGDDFYSYAYVKNKIYNTGIIPKKNTRLEFWFKPDESDYIDSNSIVIMNNANSAYGTIFGIFHNTVGNNSYFANVGGYQINFNLTNGVLYHIVLSVVDGLVINGEQIGTFSSSSNFSQPLYINGISNDLNASADGEFGMIKIDGVVIIPTADGFLNTSTGKLLEVVKDGYYKFTEISKPSIEGNLYRTINVDVVPKINIQKEGIKLSYGTFTEVPEWADFNGVTNMARMFSDCRNLQTIPLIDTSNVTDMSYMFNYCNHLQTIPLLNTSNVTNMEYMFNEVNLLQTIPLLNTSNVTNMNYMFSNCSSLQTIPPLNTSKVIYAANMFERCFDLISIPALDFRGLKMDSFNGFFGWYELTNLTDFGGFLNLKSSLTNDKNLKQLPNLTYESCINVLNGLYDFTGNGETPGSNQGQLNVHQNFLDAVGEEISIGTNKGWTITV